MGFRDGLPIGIGYFAISFGFGILASSYGIPILETVLVSAFNLTSAGQLAAVPIIASAGSLIELALTQLLINLRYSLMAISLSQRFDEKIRIVDRLYLAFALTDEIFAVSIGKPAKIGKRYLLALYLFPYIGWTMGTLFGSVVGNVLPELLVSALSVSLYAMFIAIVVPSAKESKPVAVCILISVLMSIIFKYVPLLSKIPNGFVIIIIALIASAVLSVFKPIKDEKEANE